MTLRGAIDAFPLETIVQLLAATGKTGDLLVRGDERSGTLAVSGGRLVSARSDESDGPLALGALFTVVRGDFEFAPRESVEEGGLDGDLGELLERATEERDRILEIREVVPSDRTRFRLSERAAEGGDITLSPTQWRTLLAVDGQRDVAGVAERTNTDRLSAASVLAGLVRAGMIDAVEGETTRAAETVPGYHRLPPVRSIPPTRDGERIVLRGSAADFPIETVLELLADTRKTGRLEIMRGPDARVLRMREGRLVAASWGEEEGELALGAAFTVTGGEFEFVPMPEVTQSDLAGELDELLDRAASVRDRILAVQAAIPDERSRFVLSDRATRQPQIVLMPEQWRVLLAVNGERDVAAMADHLRMRRLPVMMLVADLLRDGFVDAVAPPVEPTWPQVERRRAAGAPGAVAEPEPAPAEPEPAPEPGLAESEPEPLPEPVLEEPMLEEPVIEEPLPEAAAPETAAMEPLPEEVEEPLAEAPLDTPVIDDRLAALSGLFGPAEPAPPPPAWEEPPAAEATPAEMAAAEATAEAYAARVEPPVEEAPAVEEARLAEVMPGGEEPAAAAAPPAPERHAAPDTSVAPLPSDLRRPPAARPKRGLFGLFGKEEAAAPAMAATVARSRAGQLALLANELVAAYNSGRYGGGRVDDRMSGRLMRVDEQADPIDRPVPLSGGRVDVAGVEGMPERQSVPYLALLVRQIYDDAERVHGKDKARRGFRDVRERLFGRDDSLLRSPEVAARMPRA